MSKLNQLKGIANNLADSFVSVTNLSFLGYLKKLPIEETNVLNIDLLNEKIMPEHLVNNLVKKTVNNYKNWFSSEIEKLGISLEEIESVLIKIAFKVYSQKSVRYSCNVKIKAKGKEYEGIVNSTFS